ncbi:MAG: hypothetical protein SF052_10650 [Bacteroidia bacterium]|nr:hypothetical protein [Bacteroidia bacterium]
MASNTKNPNVQPDDFYIGYLPQIPASYRKPLLFAVVFAGLFLVGGAWLWVSSQKKFPVAAFDLGKPVTLKGIVFQEPVPAIRVVSGRDFLGNQVFQTIPLINFGKFGASGLLREYEQKTGKPLNQGETTLEGTLIYRDGKTLFELTSRSNALKGFSDDLSAYDEEVRRLTTTALGEAELTGEIVDPKCYFGVMKPGEGKVHRACASLCIRGGIPPVLVSKDENGSSTYFLLLGQNGEMINEKILDYIAVPSRFTGKVFQADDWFLFYVNPEEITPI